MKIHVIEQPRVIMNNPASMHNYFGWPTAVRLQNGRIAVGASGFRLSHICPFGKAVLSFSEDNGKTYTAPAAVIDTALDDRDAGLCPFGESGLILTSFNNTRKMQRRFLKGHLDRRGEAVQNYVSAYLDSVTDEAEAASIGATFRISRDCGVTFGPIHKSPITSPHGPIELPNGTVLWVGSTFRPDHDGESIISAYTLNVEDGTMEKLADLPLIFENGQQMSLYEPYTICCDDGKLICHIRVEPSFTLYQSVSEDGGRTWSQPERLLPDRGGAPMHLLRHSSGVLIGVYGYRDLPYGIRVMFSKDNGKTWDVNHTVYATDISADLGYPTTVELDDGSLLTVFYAREEKTGPSVIMQTVWRFEE